MSTANISLQRRPFRGNMSSSLVADVPPTAFWEFKPWRRYPIESTLHKFCICPLKHVFNCDTDLVTDTVAYIVWRRWQDAARSAAVLAAGCVEVITKRQKVTQDNRTNKRPYFHHNVIKIIFFLSTWSLVHSYYSSLTCIVMHSDLTEDFEASDSTEEYAKLQFLSPNKHTACLRVVVPCILVWIMN